jgi:aminoglycoside 2'-N-acetyltransferase I
VQPTDRIRVAVAPSADVDLRELRAFLDAAFGPTFSDAAFDHALGGVHVAVREGGELVAHAALIKRQLLHRGRALRTGYVEA